MAASLSSIFCSAAQWCEDDHDSDAASATAHLAEMLHVLNH